MKRILITGGTVFVSRSLAEYFVAKGEEVFVLNRNNHPQPTGVTLIEADRYHLGEVLKSQTFDVVIDVNTYTGEEMTLLLDGLPEIKEYVFISTSAVYPETLAQPFKETQKIGANKYWTTYGSNKIAAEEILQARVPQAYILRPAYIYGPYNNAYREAFVFDCAKNQRPFYLPSNGEMKLQFILMADVCRLIDEILQRKPLEKIYNVGNEQTVSIKDWVKACYEVVDAPLKIIEVPATVNQGQYLPFPDYEYILDVTRQTELIGPSTDLKRGLAASWEWYQENEGIVSKRDYLPFIEKEFEG